MDGRGDDMSWSWRRSFAAGMICSGDIWYIVAWRMWLVWLILSYYTWRMEGRKSVSVLVYKFTVESCCMFILYIVVSVILFCSSLSSDDDIVDLDLPVHIACYHIFCSSPAGQSVESARWSGGDRRRRRWRGSCFILKHPIECRIALNSSALNTINGWRRSPGIEALTSWCWLMLMMMMMMFVGRLVSDRRVILTSWHTTNRTGQSPCTVVHGRTSLSSRSLGKWHVGIYYM